ncbi:MAG TPA: hypothetical protein PLQ38_02125 [Methanothrix sp.]|nr:hypothetical protein [Methanothrix sp.]
MTPIHLNDCEEVMGNLGQVEPWDDDTVLAHIGRWAVLLPADLKLPSGHISVLRIDDEFYVRGD